jgi:hypothetical protein
MATRSLDCRLDVLFRHAMPLAQVRRRVCGHASEPQPVGVHPLDVDGRQRSLELAGNLDSDGDAAAGHTDHYRLLELEGGERLGQGAPGGRAVTEERRDPRDEAHAVIVPGRRVGRARAAGTAKPASPALVLDGPVPGGNQPMKNDTVRADEALYGEPMRP